MNTSSVFSVKFHALYRICQKPGNTDLSETIAEHLDEGITAIGRTFKIAVEIPFLNVFICPSRSVFDDFVGLFTNTPTDPARIGQAQGHDIYMLSPSAYRTDAPGYATNTPPYYDPIVFKHNLIHELVHVWEEISSPPGAMDVRPGWFSEGLAMVISESHTETAFRKQVRNQCKAGGIPDPDRINGAGNYAWGALLVLYLMETQGFQWFPDVIFNTAETDILSLAGRDREAVISGYRMFTRKWMEDVHI